MQTGRGPFLEAGILATADLALCLGLDDVRPSPAAACAMRFPIVATPSPPETTMAMVKSFVGIGILPSRLSLWSRARATRPPVFGIEPTAA